jgi:predicted AAA+ superfamily ATPase
MIAFPLDPFDQSVRKRQAQKAKLYFFDPGVVRALNNRVEIPIQSGNYEYGDLFEHFLILEFHRLNAYYEKRFRFSYLRTKDDLEIDLLIERPRGKPLLVEIKSSDRIDKAKLSSAKHIAQDIPHETFYWLSRTPEETEIDGVRCVHWQQGLNEIFGLSPKIKNKMC